MKKLVLIMVVALAALTGCSKGNEEQEPVKQDLLLSISDEKIIIRDEHDLTYLFNILQGNGAYTLFVEDTTIAEATLDENTVSLRFKNNGETMLTISDRENESKTIRLICDKQSLITPYTAVYMYKGAELQNKLSFGTGNYSIVRVSGKSQEVWIENDMLHIHATGIFPGITYVTVADGWGTLQVFEFNVYEQ